MIICLAKISQVEALRQAGSRHGSSRSAREAGTHHDVVTKSWIEDGTCLPAGRLGTAPPSNPDKQLGNFECKEYNVHFYFSFASETTSLLLLLLKLSNVIILVVQPS